MFYMLILNEYLYDCHNDDNVPLQRYFFYSSLDAAKKAAEVMTHELLDHNGCQRIHGFIQKLRKMKPN